VLAAPTGGVLCHRSFIFVRIATDDSGKYNLICHRMLVPAIPPLVVTYGIARSALAPRYCSEAGLDPTRFRNLDFEIGISYYPAQKSVC